MHEDSRSVPMNRLILLICDTEEVQQAITGLIGAAADGGQQWREMRRTRGIFAALCAQITP